ncbi:hypothetical protein [Nocardia sp. NBC_00511]|uniref:hypothetical protein n=1 Tax=Nocardia sp. NBC_00511 TaxID=2903591 RepID=UPI0030E4051B
MRGKTPPTEPLTGRERRNLLLGTMIVVAVLSIGAVAWTLLDHRPNFGQSGNGCVTVQFASSLGAAQQRACGTQAVEWCRSADTQPPAVAGKLREQCRIAGIPLAH